MVAATANNSETTAAEMCTWSAHRGSRPVRTDRDAPMMITATPRVSRVRRCSHRTERTGSGTVPRRTRPKSGMRVTISADATDAHAASRKTERTPNRWISSAPRSGPIRMPRRIDPPRSAIPRARWLSGTASIRKPCRASRNAVQLMPLTNTQTHSSQTEGTRNATIIATASTRPAITRVRRSPSRATSAPEGSELTSWPIPSSATTNAAMAVAAPRLPAWIASTGITAPWPIELTTEGR